MFWIVRVPALHVVVDTYLGGWVAYICRSTSIFFYYFLMTNIYNWWTFSILFLAPLGALYVMMWDPQAAIFLIFTQPITIPIPARWDLHSSQYHTHTSHNSCSKSLQHDQCNSEHTLGTHDTPGTLKDHSEITQISLGNHDRTLGNHERTLGEHSLHWRNAPMSLDNVK